MTKRVSEERQLWREELVRNMERAIAEARRYMAALEEEMLLDAQLPDNTPSSADAVDPVPPSSADPTPRD